MKALGIVIVGIFAIILFWFLGLSLGILTLPFHTASNFVQTAHDVTDQTINADNAIYNYEWFKQQYEDIQAFEKKAVLAQEAVKEFEASGEPRNTWTFEDKNEYNRLRAVELGIRNQIEDMVATYNARSKMANRVIFRDGLIPDYLEIGKNILTNINL